MNIYLDDERKTPDGFVRCYWPEEVKKLVLENEVDTVSLDHDLGNDEIGTGYTFVKWLEEYSYNNPDFKLPNKIIVHSQNPVGAKKMRATIERIYYRKEKGIHASK
jgi:hypothetical protein